MPRSDRVLPIFLTRPDRRSEALLSQAAWPVTHRDNAYARFFPSPASALERLDLAFERLLANDPPIDRRHVSQAYRIAVLALSLSAEDMPAHPRWVGTLVSTLTEHLTQLPELVLSADIEAALETLAERLVSASSLDLQAVGQELASALTRASNPDKPGRTLLSSAPKRARRLAPQEVCFSDLFRGEGDLDEESAYRGLLRESLQDGSVDLFEWATLRGLASALRLSPETQERLEGEVRAEPAMVDPNTDADCLDLGRYITDLHDLAEDDGVVRASERRVLAHVARFFEMTPGDIQSLRAA